MPIFCTKCGGFGHGPTECRSHMYNSKNSRSKKVGPSANGGGKATAVSAKPSSSRLDKGKEIIRGNDINLKTNNIIDSSVGGASLAPKDVGKGVKGVANNVTAKSTVGAKVIPTQSPLEKPKKPWVGGSSIASKNGGLSSSLRDKQVTSGGGWRLPTSGSK